MKIAYIGNYSQRHCTENHIAATFESMGHEVLRLQENDLKRDWAIKTITSKPDLVLYTRTWGNYVTSKDLNVIKLAHIPTASWHLDLYLGLKRQSGMRGDPFWQTDFVFTPDGDPNCANIFKRMGINHYYLPPATFKPEVYTAERTDWRHDVIFVGGGTTYGHKTEWPYRAKLVTWLKNTYGNNYGKYGAPEQVIRNEALNDLYSNSKIVVGDTLCLNFTHRRYFSDRLTETIGRGGFIIHPYIDGIRELFTEDELITYNYNDFEDLKKKIDYYIEHESEREVIRKAGQQRVLKDHTYNNRVQTVLDMIYG